MFKKLIIMLVALCLFSSIALALSLNGAGATFPYPIYSKWTSEYNKITGVNVNYQPIGSGGGVRQFIAGIVDFGASDDPMTNDEIIKAGGDVLHIPTVIGSVALSYNLPGIQDIRLDSDTLVKIFMGEIKNWNDPAIVQLNPGVNFPDVPITVAHRSDGSGTTAVFSGYLSKVSSAWSAKVGKGKSLNWPVGVGGKGNAGVAGIIQENKGAIGYIELAYAITNNLPVVLLKNRAGYFVKPSIDSTIAAAAGSINRIPADFRADLNNAPGKNAYPIVSMTWLLVQKKQTDKEKGEALVNFLKWALTSGQEFANVLLYAPLPSGLQGKVLSAINTISY